MMQIPARPFDFPLARDRVALVIIDMQRDFIELGGFGASLGNDVRPLQAIVPTVARLLAGFRAAGLPIFHTREGYFALGNCDPFSGANVLARGIVGDLAGKLVVASPVYKQHFCLRTGICLEDMTVTVPVWRVVQRNGRILVSEER